MLETSYKGFKNNYRVRGNLVLLPTRTKLVVGLHKNPEITTTMLPYSLHLKQINIMVSLLMHFGVREALYMRI